MYWGGASDFHILELKAFSFPIKISAFPHIEIGQGRATCGHAGSCVIDSLIMINWQ